MSVMQGDKSRRRYVAIETADQLHTFARIIEWIAAFAIGAGLLAAFLGGLPWFEFGIVAAVILGNAALLSLGARSISRILVLLVDIEDNTREAAAAVKFTADEYRKSLDIEKDVAEPATPKLGNHSQSSYDQPFRPPGDS